MNIDEILLLIAFIVIGIILLGDSVFKYYKIRLIKNTDEISIAEAVDKSGMVQISGTPQKYREILNSPLGDDECFAYEYDVSKSRKSTADPEHDYRWKTVEEETQVVDFVLADHSGTARIETDSAEISLTHDTRHTIADSSAVPTTVPQDNAFFNPKNYNFKDRLRFKEGTIKSYDRIFIIGEFDKTDDGENSETCEINPDEKIYISSRNAENEIKELRTPAIFEFIIGSSFLLFALAVIIREFQLV